MALSVTPSEIIEKGEYPLLVKADHWARVPLSSVASVQNGFAFKSIYFSRDAGMPLIRIRDVTKSSPEHNFTGDYTPEFVVKCGDILIGMDGDFKAAHWTGPTGLLNQRVCRIKSSGPHFDSKFLFLCLQPFLNAINAETSSVTVKHLSSRTIQDIPLPLPPLNEQKRIVAKIEELFSELDKGVESLKTARAQLKIYRQAVLKHAFEGKLTAQWREDNKDRLETADDLLERIQKEREARYQQQLEDWETTVLVWKRVGQEGKKPAKPRKIAKLEEIRSQELEGISKLPNSWQWCKMGQLFSVYVGSTPSRKKQEFWAGSIPWVSSGEVAFCRITDTREKITAAGYDSASTQIHPTGTVMLAMIGEGKTRGQAAVLDIEASHNQNTAAIRVSETDCSTSFFYNFLLYQYEITRKLGSGNNQKALNKDRVSNMFFPLAPVKEQVEIAKKIDLQLSILEHLERDILENLERESALRQSILKKAFSGKLVAQDPNDEPASVLLERIKAEKNNNKKKGKAA